MSPLLSVLVLAAYIVALYLFWADKSLRPLLLLFAGSGAMVAEPLWHRLFGSTPHVPGSVIQIGTFFVLPLWTLIGGGVIIAVPALVVLYGMRHRWWNLHYASAWIYFALFVLYFMVVDVWQVRSSLRLFADPQLPSRSLVEALFQALLLAGVSFGMLYTFVSTRHYALQIAVIPLLLSGIASGLLLFGILCSPFWVARLLQQSDRIQLVSAGISVILVLWGVHLLARGLHAGRLQHLQWR